MLTDPSGNALTDFFLKDVGIQQNEFNIGQQLFAAGVLVLQVISRDPFWLDTTFY